MLKSAKIEWQKQSLVWAECYCKAEVTLWRTAPSNMVRLLSSARRVSFWAPLFFHYFIFLYLSSSGGVRMGGWPEVTFTKKRPQPSYTKHPKGSFNTDFGVWGRNDERTEGATFKCQIKACGRAEDEKIVALILETHKPKHMDTHAQCNGKPKRYITSVLFIQMVWMRSSELTVSFRT